MVGLEKMIELNCINQSYDSQMNFVYLGHSEYQEIENLQKKMVQEIKSSDAVTVLGIEFNPVLTMGIRANPSLDFQSELDDIKQKFQIIQTDRGGQATVHSPGQLIIYPMIDLKFYKLGVQQFVRLILSVTQTLFLKYGIELFYDENHPGLYFEKKKICYLGLKIDNGVVRHGLAININNELELFNSIRSCGIRCQEHTSLSQIFLNKEIADNTNIVSTSNRVSTFTLNNIFNEWCLEFKKQLKLAF